jgi:hypothetical protein
MADLPKRVQLPSWQRSRPLQEQRHCGGRERERERERDRAPGTLTTLTTCASPRAPRQHHPSINRGLAGSCATQALSGRRSPGLAAARQPAHGRRAGGAPRRACASTASHRARRLASSAQVPTCPPLPRGQGSGPGPGLPVMRRGRIAQDGLQRAQRALLLLLQPRVQRVHLAGHLRGNGRGGERSGLRVCLRVEGWASARGRGFASGLRVWRALRVEGKQPMGCDLGVARHSAPPHAMPGGVCYR